MVLDSSNSLRAAPDEVHDERDNSKEDEQMDQKTTYMQHEEASDPKDCEYYS
jgi:hypothetical protein